MTSDIKDILDDWRYKPGDVIARQVETIDGRPVLQMRLDLGLLQMEILGRPDGEQPHGFESYFSYLRHLVDTHPDEPFFLDDEQCMNVDREFLQYYHRRVCWLALKDYDKAIGDADHNLAFMDFVKRHSPNEQYTLAHEQFRCFVIYHRAQAAVGKALDKESPEDALDVIHESLENMKTFYCDHNLENQFQEDSLVQRLHELDNQVRDRFHIETTLREQLEDAIENEQFELAAELRDNIQKRQESCGEKERS
jgi:hypothetical protein